MMTKSHYYPDMMLSPFPILASISSFNLLSSFVLLMKVKSWDTLILSVISVILGAMLWWVSLDKEFTTWSFSNLMGGCVKWSFIFFISSEVFLFSSLFWSYFHFSLSPCNETGQIWPPASTEFFDVMGAPMANTLILITSSITVTIAHQFLLEKKSLMYNLPMVATIALGILFSYMQSEEYRESFFSMSDSSFGSSFYTLTGLHGMHVLVGTLMLCYALILPNMYTMDNLNFLSFEMAAWYWHFVDFVWMVVFYSLYYLNF